MEVIGKRKEGTFPKGLDIKLTADQSERTRSDLTDLINTVILGFIFVVLVLMFFMGVRDAFFVGLSVPLSALMAFLFMPSLGFSLNMIVLFGFLLGLGIVVDDAIVVIENSHRLFNRFKELDIKEAVKLAASEVFIPVLSGTMTTICPFLPLMFWPGIVGEFMKFLPITLILTLFASLFVAYIMNPVFAVSFMTRESEETPEKVKKSFIKSLKIMGTITIVAYLLGFLMGNFGLGNFSLFILLFLVLNHFVLNPMIHKFQTNALVKFKNSYKKLISWAISGYRSVGIVVSMVFLLIFTFVLMRIVKPNVIFFPTADPNFVYVYIQMPIGTDAKVTNVITEKIENKIFEVLKKNDAEKIVNSIISNVGKNAGDPQNPDRALVTPHKSKITVAFVKNEEREGKGTLPILNEISKSIKAMNIAGAQISVEQERSGPPTGKPITIEVMGEEFDTLIALDKRLRKVIQKSGIEGIDELKSDLVTNKPEIIIHVDREKASREGVSSGQIAMAIRTALYGLEISKFRDAKDEYPIMLRLKANDRSQLERLLGLNISFRDMNLGGVFRQIPLSAVADISYATSFSQINRKNQRRIVTISSEVTPEYKQKPNLVVAQVQDIIDGMEIPSGYFVKMGGEQEEQMAAMRFLSNAFLIAILMIFLILVLQFNSLMKPMIIFVTIILSLIGVLLGFIVFNKSFSVIMSGIGIVALAGIVVKNGILLIEFIDELRMRGYSLKEAIIEGGATRLTPVLLTAAAAILGLLPLAWGVSLDFVGLFTHFKPHFFLGAESSVFWNILAWTIIFGLSFSTILTLVVVPCMYYLMEKVQIRFQK